MRLYKQAHTVYRTQYHVVWVTRYRRKILCRGVDDYLRAILHGLRKYYPDVRILEIGIDLDHVHLHMVIPPKYSVSRILEAIKSNTSRMLRQKFSHFLSEVYWDNQGIWGTGFFASTIGLNEDIIRSYVRQQGDHDAGQLEELQ